MVELTEFDSRAALFDRLARTMSAVVRDKPTAVLGLATGRTFVDFYARWVERARADGVSFGALRTFNLDEYLGLAPGSPNTFRAYMERHLFGRADFDPARTHLPDPWVPDPGAEAVRYERALQGAGGIDVQLLGLGNNGHIGFNEPGSSFASRTRAVELTAETRAQNAADFAGEAVPTRALTMGLATIAEARRCYLVVVGEAKAGILARCLAGRDERYPASALWGHPGLEILADAAACSALENLGDRVRRTKHAVRAA